MSLVHQAPAIAATKTGTIVWVGVHPTEAKYDKIMEKYATGLKAAFAEKDDKKTIVMVNKLNDDMVTSLQQLKPELEKWIKGMTEADKEAFEERAGSKPYLKTIFEIMFNPEIGKRIEQNPDLKKALDSGNARMKELGFDDEESNLEEGQK
ncbi:hypothetical protein [Pontibacter fetidus]|uniref:Uncharacterized protein n=1 Tax=Pontibacter fetidus TaxID=2700082 RepID=A0A6B2HAT1_9BACT|nr:hypothetical protein [Pontibacter fetidus]NDK56882.1 hypothetical protein [Pontibacter fetidus]